MTKKGTSLEPTPRDRGYAWIIVVSVFFLQAIQDGVRFSYGLFFVEFLREFKKGKAETAWIGSIMLSVFNLGGPVSAYVVNKFGCRIGTMVGAIITATGFVLSYFAPNLYYLYFTFGALQGFGFGMVFLSGYVITAVYFKKRRALAVGITFCGGGIGTFVFLPVARLIIDSYRWRGAMFILAGVTLNECVCASLLRPFIEGETEIEENDTAKEAQKAATGNRQEIKRQSNENTLPPGNATEEHCIPLLAMANVSVANNESAHITSDIAVKQDLHLNEKRDGPTKCSASKSLPDIREDKECSIKTNKTENRYCNSSKSLNSVLLANNLYGSPSRGYDVTVLKETHDIPQLSTSQTADLQIEAITVNNDNDQNSKGSERRFKNAFIESICPKELLTNIHFIIFMVSTVFIAIPEFVPYSMLPDFALTVNCSSQQAAWTLSVVGIGATVSQISAGWLADMECVHNLSLLGCCILAIGATTMTVAVIPMFGTLITYSALYGMLSGAMYSVQPIVLLEYIGDKYMASMQGLTMWVYGISGLIGTPAAGWLFDATGSYTVSFLSAGACFVVSGAINFLVLCKKHNRKAMEQK